MDGCRVASENQGTPPLATRHSQLATPLTRIGVVSDTHGFFHPALPDVLAGSDLILHAGDIGFTGDVLGDLERIAPVRAVWGNIDDAAMRRRVPEHERFAVEGVRFWMTHIGGRPGRWAKGVGPALRADPPDVFVAGHSHVLQVGRVPERAGMLFVNPGAAGRQGFHTVKTCVRLVVDAGRVAAAEAVYLDG